MQRLNQILLLLAVAGVLVGCASKPGPLGREAAEERFPELAADPAEPVPSYGADWADDFGEPGLIELIETTLEENPDAAAAAARAIAGGRIFSGIGLRRFPWLVGQEPGEIHQDSKSSIFQSILDRIFSMSFATGSENRPPPASPKLSPVVTLTQ